MAVKFTAQDVIDIALAQNGYLEKASNASLDSFTDNAGFRNYTKFGRDLDLTGMYNGKKNGYEWCDQFVDWCVMKAAEASGGDWHDAQTALCQPDGGCGAGCYFSYNYYKAAGRASAFPQVGAQIFFVKNGEICHTGLVYKVTTDTVYTIEGNTSGASGVISNGGGVCKKQYARSSSYVYGYGLPKYATESAVAQEDHSPSVAKGMAKFTNSTGDNLPVYSGTRMDNKTGSLNSGESCYCFGKVWSEETNRWLWLVAYGLDDYPAEWKTGYVDDGGGTTF